MKELKTQRKPIVKTYFRKVGHAWGINKKGHILVNFLECENATT